MKPVDDRARRLALIDAAIARAAEQRAELLDESDIRTPWPNPIAPNDRERELALRTMNQHNRGDSSTAVLITSIAHALANYRIELSNRTQEQ